MIYTVTLNPSLDYIVTVPDFRLGRVNRTKGEILFPGGKGINVSVVLKNLGIDSRALGFMAGFTGEEIVRLLKERGIVSDFIHVEKGISRINVKLKGREESEVNGKGPAISEADIRKLHRQLGQLKDGDILVLAGSIPDVLPDSVYMDIMELLKEKNLKIVVDATGDLLVKALPYRPFLVKPNNHELGEIFHTEISTAEQALEYAEKMREMGAENVLVSMAGEGAVLADKNGRTYRTKPPAGTLVNSVGAGDSMVAGFLAGFLKTGDYREAFLTGVCAGSASAFSKELATQSEVAALRRTMEPDGATGERKGEA